MPKYMIQFRFFGSAKYEIKELVNQVSRKFGIRSRHRTVPHITLAGPFTTRDRRRLLNEFEDICMSAKVMHFEVSGFDTFPLKRVVYINIEPDHNLERFRWDLSKRLQDFCRLKSFDYDQKFHFHATIALKIPFLKYLLLKRHVNSLEKPNYKQVMLRATLLYDGKILREYDFLQRKMLDRRHAKSRSELNKTFAKLRQYLRKDINEYNTVHDNQTVKINLNDSYFHGKKIFFISDTHFDHSNIIKYCNRPFQTRKEMNNYMLKKWNETVKKNDVVFFLGDMSFGRRSRGADYWLSRLNGQVYFIKGNHDKIRKTKNVYDSAILSWKRRKIYLTHIPRDVPSDWKGWAICGHHHNNDLSNFPLVNKNTKRMNVGVELLDYIPIEINELFNKV